MGTMDFSFGEDIERFRKEVRDFCEKEWPQELRGWRGWVQPDTPEFIEKAEEFDRKLASKGWLGLAIPKKYGGTERSIVEQYVLFDEVKRAHCPPNLTGGSLIFTPTILNYGTEEQKKQFLPAIARGEMDFCLGYSEPNAGSDAAALQLRAERQGDFYILNGNKIFTTQAHVVKYCWLAARTDPEAPKHRGISLLIVDMKTPGITIRPMPCMGNERTNETFWDNVKVPVANRIGGENEGWRAISTAMGLERLVPFHTTCVRLVFDELVSFLKTAEYGGWRPREDPYIRSKVGQLSAELEVCQALEYRTLWILDQGQTPFAEGSMLKLRTTELYQRVTDTFTQVLGLYGQLTKGSAQAPLDGGLIQQYESSIVATIFAGTSEIQRTIIALAGLGLPAS
jgi:alkylation response protein AidB-like acyl-CoA dehydrogenase